ITSSPLTSNPAKFSSVRCCRKNPPGSHSNANRPDTLSSSEPSVRPVTSQVPTNRSSRLSAGSGRGGCIACASWSFVMTTSFLLSFPYDVWLASGRGALQGGAEVASTPRRCLRSLGGSLGRPAPVMVFDCLGGARRVAQGQQGGRKGCGEQSRAGQGQGRGGRAEVEGGPPGGGLGHADRHQRPIPGSGGPHQAHPPPLAEGSEAQQPGQRGQHLDGVHRHRVRHL